MSYPDIMNMWMYDFQNAMLTYQRIVEERHEAEEKQAKEQGYDKNKFNPDSMMKSASNMMPKMPTMPSMGGMKFK